MGYSSKSAATVPSADSEVQRQLAQMVSFERAMGVRYFLQGKYPRDVNLERTGRDPAVQSVRRGGAPDGVEASSIHSRPGLRLGCHAIGVCNATTIAHRQERRVRRRSARGNR